MATTSTTEIPVYRQADHGKRYPTDYDYNRISNEIDDAFIPNEDGSLIGDVGAYHPGPCIMVSQRVASGQRNVTVGNSVQLVRGRTVLAGHFVPVRGHYDSTIRNRMGQLGAWVETIDEDGIAEAIEALRTHPAAR